MDLQTEFIVENIRLQNTGEAKECHTNAKIISERLKKKGYNIKLVTGFYINLPKKIRHSWIEFGDKILETDCKQLREEGDIMPNEFCSILDKSVFSHRYKNE